MHTLATARLEAIARNFAFSGACSNFRLFGDGHINDTYRLIVTTEDGPSPYLIQRINHIVFKEPRYVMENIVRITTHLRKKIRSYGGNPRREAITIVPTHDGQNLYRDNEGNYWRAMVCIEGARTFAIATPSVAYNAAKAFGIFQHLLSDVDVSILHETIPDFHNTPLRFLRLVDTIKSDTCNRVKTARREMDFILQRERDTSVLTTLAQNGDIPVRVTHNDTKLDNVLIDDTTGAGLCVIDLDTVMPGLSLYDFGDCCRSAINPVAEDELELSKVSADERLFEQLATGYLTAARDFLLPAEIEHLAFSAKLITLEQGIRFLTDYLQGDPYYKIRHESHNLHRCRNQLALVSSIEQKMERLQKIVLHC